MEEFFTGVVLGFVIGFFLMLWISISHCDLPAYVVIKKINEKQIETSPLYYLPYNEKYAIGDTIRFY